MLTFCKQIFCFVIAKTFYMCMVLFEICMVIFEKCQLLVAELIDIHLYHAMSSEKFRTIETLFPLKRKVRKLKQDVITINSTTNEWCRIPQPNIIWKCIVVSKFLKWKVCFYLVWLFIVRKNELVLSVNRSEMYFQICKLNRFSFRFCRPRLWFSLFKSTQKCTAPSFIWGVR